MTLAVGQTVAALHATYPCMDMKMISLLTI